VIIGLDPSLTHSAGFVASAEPRGFAIKSRPGPDPLARLIAIRAAFVRELEAAEGNRTHDVCGSRVLFTEGYAFGAKNGREALGELGGTLRLAAYERGWTVVVVPPTVLKAYVTGKGVAPKEVMLREVFRRWAYEAPDNNAADAYALMRLGLEWCAAQRGEAITKRVGELLGKVQTWSRAAA
jgi:hypothetical protein